MKMKKKKPIFLSIVKNPGRIWWLIHQRENRKRATTQGFEEPSLGSSPQWHRIGGDLMVSLGRWVCFHNRLHKIEMIPAGEEVKITGSPVDHRGEGRWVRGYRCYSNPGGRCAFTGQTALVTGMGRNLGTHWSLKRAEPHKESQGGSWM